MTPLAMSLLGGLVRHKGVSQRTGLFLLPCTGKTLLLSIELFKIQQLVTTQQRRCEYDTYCTCTPGRVWGWVFCRCS